MVHQRIVITMAFKMICNINIEDYYRSSRELKDSRQGIENNIELKNIEE